MANIQPFRGIRHSTEKFDNLADVYAPPYDVISDRQREQLIAKSDHNIVRIDFGEQLPTDGTGENRYHRAKRLLDEWLAEGALVRDERPTLTIYAQEFILPDGREVKRAGIFTAVELMELGPEGVMPHEKTFEGPKADRLMLTQATNANLSAIFALYTDEAGTAEGLIQAKMNEPATTECTTDDGLVHRTWVVDDPDFIRQIQEALSDKSLYIADGHHRYETALNYALHTRKGKPRSGPPAPADHTLMYLVNTENPGLEILPTHRVLRMHLATDVDEFVRRVTAFFEVSPLGINWTKDRDAAARIGAKLAEAGEQTTAFALLLPDGSSLLLTLRGGADLDEMIPEPMPRQKKRLDASVLHFFVLSRAWIGDPEHDLDEEECKYSRDIGEVMDLLRGGQHCAAFLMNATTMDQLKEISAFGERMPQKSTYFYPKIATGVVIRMMDE